ncbi:molecular chaperone TorD family protein [Aestuariirhabdus sp. Z084]|uniref:TorD/DmsD family molecular chaperone n=1 Tax=Aestuariirhabdus haliotis TaxID=2918751 RepID=UPI00201B40EC|nr:molecular chaperone TorD family protein [Aestuariirhabdus haliotis]MCL6416255.1 molecular chaperone TorD family protein [Aestuariirhabdus haliotis]MCL6420285.1 molecular chaperone TorD family protein [Aestuariirhabdus haliotis]
MSADLITTDNAVTATNALPVLSDEDHLRAEGYALLGTLLRGALSDELMQLLAGIEIESAHSPIEHAYSTLQQSAVHTRVEAARQEYQSLFIGIGRGELLPFGSWYQTGFMMEKPLVKLRQDLQELGFERQQDTHEPEDHVAALCEVMTYLIEAGSTEQQQRFFRTHMQGWIQRFFDDLQNANNANFYIAVGQLGEALLQAEIDRFDQP